MTASVVVSIGPPSSRSHLSNCILALGNYSELMISYEKPEEIASWKLPNYPHPTAARRLTDEFLCPNRGFSFSSSGRKIRKICLYFMEIIIVNIFYILGDEVIWRNIGLFVRLWIFLWTFPKKNLKEKSQLPLGKTNLYSGVAIICLVIIMPFHSVWCLQKKSEKKWKEGRKKKIKRPPNEPKKSIIKSSLQNLSSARDQKEKFSKIDVYTSCSVLPPLREKWQSKGPTYKWQFEIPTWFVWRIFFFQIS